jgi:hypothetical protein
MAGGKILNLACALSSDLCARSWILRHGRLLTEMHKDQLKETKRSRESSCKKEAMSAVPKLLVQASMIP